MWFSRDQVNRWVRGQPAGETDIKCRWAKFTMGKRDVKEAYGASSFGQKRFDVRCNRGGIGSIGREEAHLAAGIEHVLSC